MRADEIAAERASEVRDAARAWQGAGFIGEETLTRIVAFYPDDRARFGPGFRILAFVFTGIGVWAMVGLSAILFGSMTGADSVLSLFWAVILTLLTEFQRGPLKRADGGGESATGLIAALLAIISIMISVDSDGTAFVIQLLVSSTLICAIAAWRWGDRLFFLGAALSVFFLLAQTGPGRLLWIIAAAMLIPACLKWARAPWLAPSHRTGAMIVGAVAVLALYAAIHIWSWDERAIEWMCSGRCQFADRLPPSKLRPLSVLATVFLPPRLFLLGWRRREPLLLYSGLILLGVSIATIRLYYAVMPLYLALILIGSACLGLALGVRKWLRAAETGERHGFTADPLFANTNRTDVIKSVGAMASFTPAAQTAPAPEGFKGGGGSFGGGGASGNF